MIDVDRTTLICPRNDEESLQILKIAKAMGLSVVVSKQPHGARLENEKKLLKRILKSNSHTEVVVIIEIPGEKAEAELFADGLQVITIDHHKYKDLDRMNLKSSLEQFRDLFNISAKEARSLGFDPKMLDAVAAIDRGFVWEMVKLGWNRKDQIKGIEYYQNLTSELGVKRRVKEEKIAYKAWIDRTIKKGILVIKSKNEHISIRSAISFIIAKSFNEPQESIIKQGRRRIYVQDTEYADQLLKEFGGFTFGKNACWGLLSKEGHLPTINEILAIIAR